MIHTEIIHILPELKKEVIYIDIEEKLKTGNLNTGQKQHEQFLKISYFKKEYFIGTDIPNAEKNLKILKKKNTLKIIVVLGFKSP